MCNSRAQGFRAREASPETLGGSRQSEVCSLYVSAVAQFEQLLPNGEFYDPGKIDMRRLYSTLLNSTVLMLKLVGRRFLEPAAPPAAFIFIFVGETNSMIPKTRAFFIGS